MKVKIARLTLSGFTLIELLIVIGIVGILGTIASNSYSAYIDRAKIAQAKSDIRSIEVAISQYQADNLSKFPTALADVGKGSLLDPWGTPYQYLNLTTAAKKNAARKDKNLHPLNSDYDLYSKGKDKDSKIPLTAKSSRDDVIRANDGRFIGLADDY